MHAMYCASHVAEEAPAICLLLHQHSGIPERVAASQHLPSKLQRALSEQHLHMM